jgi:hypothetical protein
LLSEFDLAELLRRRLHQQRDVQVSGSASSYELAVLAEQVLTLNNSGAITRLADRLLQQAIRREEICFETLFAAVSHASVTTDPISMIDVFSYLMSVVRASFRPAIIFVIRDSNCAVTAFEKSVQISSTVCDLPVVCCIEQHIWAATYRNHAPCRLLSIMGENQIFLADPDGPHGSSPTGYKTDGPFRSQQEKTLYDQLQAIEETRDLFQPNAYPGFEFGNRPAEVDLLSSSLGIAIEVDGYHHFQKPERYRRDRRKDYLMQHHDYLVLRFLAEDVDRQIEPILRQIVDAVRSRRSRNSTARLTF